MTKEHKLTAAIAVTRFGLGARSGEIDQAGSDPRGYLLAQIRPEGAELTSPAPETTAKRMADYLDYKADRAVDKETAKQRSPTSNSVHDQLRDDTTADFLARITLGVTTADSFRERWALFWLNHFTVSAAKLRVASLVGPFENEAIRPHVFRRFEDLLVASSSHPAMLFYLDEARSIGPDSFVAQAQAHEGKHSGLNENLAREILELHTVGVEAGYSQADVTEFARAMTGWTVAGEHDTPRDPTLFVFHDRAHEPGVRTIMGRRYDQSGVAQARAVMTDLAANPHTAQHIAVKLARHFVADEPPPTLVARLRQSYIASNGDLAVLAKALVEAPEAWAAPQRKFKTPYEFMVSAWRATGDRPRDAAALSGAMTLMGQKPLAPPSPKGWPEEARIWCAPDAVIKRINWSDNFASQVGQQSDPMQIAVGALGDRLTAPVAKAIARAETRNEALALLLMSPEFQRR